MTHEESIVLKELIRLADELDRAGHYRVADRLDKLVTKLEPSENWKVAIKRAMEAGEPEEVEVEIPEEEREILQNVLTSLQESLQ